MALSDSDALPQEAGASTEPRKTRVPDFATPDSTVFCDTCLDDRYSTGYGEKLRRLFERLYCSACGVEHGAVLFSARQRLEPAATRIRIGEEGRVDVCPHHAVSLRDMDQLLATHRPRNGREVVWTCKEPECADLNVRMSHDVDFPQQLLVIDWSVELEIRDGENYKDVASDFVKTLMRESPALFCPHVHAAPERFTTSIRPGRKYLDDNDFNMFCYSCNQIVYLNIVENLPDAKLSIKGRRFAEVDIHEVDRRRCWDWVSRIDPESIEMHADSDSKHVMWCDQGKSCATGYGLLHFVELLKEADRGACFLAAYLDDALTGKFFVIGQIDDFAAVACRKRR